MVLLTEFVCKPWFIIAKLCYTLKSVCNQSVLELHIIKRNTIYEELNFSVGAEPRLVCIIYKVQTTTVKYSISGKRHKS